MSRKQASQVLVVKNSQVLLCFNKTGTFKGLFTGIIAECRTATETPDEAAVRGCAAVGLKLLGDAASLQKRAVLDMVERGDVVEEHEYIYTGELQGDSLSSEGFVLPKTTRRVAWEWFGLDNIPFADMPEDDAIWYPAVLAEGGKHKLLRGRFEFSDDGMVAQSIEEVDSL